RSRYTGSRFDGDRRSRSPRDRSPYGDRGERGERGPQYSDADRRRPPLDSWGTPGGFPSGRDGFRDSLSGIQPPRGPKALLDAPSGPRGGGFAGDFRGGRGRGGGRGRQWRDDSRDGARDREDYRDRPHFRDERSRERERDRDRERERERDRDWSRDQRDRVDFPRARRPSPPPLRARSPPPGRDFRDARDAPSGVDAERGRRGSRDGPLSAGSSNSDPMFAPSPFRGGFGRGGGRGAGRGRGDWDQRTGRDRGTFYDERDRYARSRSQESRWGREPEERDRRDSRYPDTARDLRDERDIRDREREIIRPKPDRVSHEPPSAKDVSPPPLAPSAPAFGSVPSRQSTTASEIQSLTGKPPPTGPRALTEERPVSAGHAVGNERPPPTGPSKPTLSDSGPPIPLGPRAQQQKQQRSSKQWINPSLNYHRDFEKRPRSPGSRSDSHAAASDRYGVHVATGPNEIVIKSERGSQSARASVDRETRAATYSGDVRMGGTDAERAPRDHDDADNKQKESPAAVAKLSEVPVERPGEEVRAPAAAQKPPAILAVPSARVQLPPREISAPTADESSESDDDEDMDVYFEREISKTEAELKKLHDAADKVPLGIVRRYATAVHEAMLRVLNDDAGLLDAIGPIPDGFTFPRPKPGTEILDKEMPDAEQEAPQPHAAASPRRSVSGLDALTEGSAPAFFPRPFDQAENGRRSTSPDEESENKTEEDASVYGSVEVVREYSATPPTEELPVYNVKPWYRSRRVRKLAVVSPEFGDFLLAHIRDQAMATQLAQEELRREYAKKYETYLRFTMSDDPAAVKSREYFTSPNTQSGTSGKAAGSDSKPEGGRRAAGRFSTELDLDYAIKESMREHQERKEREERARKEKYRSEKEAVIPDMFWTEEEKDRASFYDTAGLLPLEKVVATWQVVPQHVNFTEEEAEKFEKAYLESPKQWGKISSELPGRDPGTCILYYYAKKRELNLKEKLKKQPRRRKKGRGKQRSSALVSELGNTENETEETTAQENSENGERRRPPRRAAAPVWPHEATPNADSDGATPAPTPGRRRAGTAADAKNESGVEKPEGKRGGRKPRQSKAEKEAKGPKQLAQAPGASPSAVPSKTGRSRANSKAQGPEWVSPQTPVDLAARIPLPFEVSHGNMQPPLAPVQQPPLASPDRAAPPVASTISEVMAPPSLRPEPPPPPPPASVPTFEISQTTGPERIRTPQQASSYWSVSETTDFPALLRAFGTDWGRIAAHMQTKTATMVKNYYVRQTKEGGKPEWEQIAMEADAKAQRGEKRPAPPTPTQGPRKRYDVSTAGHRPLAAAEPDETLLAKAEPQQNQPFSRFQVPIAQASPVSHPLAQPAQPAMATPLAPSAPAQQPQPTGPTATQAMSPHIHPHPLRPPASAFAYPEREADAAPAQAQQPVRISQKPVPTAASIPTVSEPAPRPAGWATDLGQQFSMLSQAKEARVARDARERQRLELAQRESPRLVERAPPLRMKQEPEQVLHHPEPYNQFQPAQRVLSTRIEPAPLARQPEPSRATAPVPQAYAPPVQQGPPPPHQVPAASEKPLPGIQRPTSGLMQEQYGTTAVSAGPAPLAHPAPAPAPPRAPERKINVMSLLNDDDAPPPKRVADVSAVKTSSTPPPQPQSMVRQPPPPPPSARRETEPGYAYTRNPAQAPQSAIPPLKPYHTQSPQPQHVRVPSTGMASAMDPAAEAQRDYYGRHSYPSHPTHQSHPSQHAVSASSSPQAHQAHHYAPPGHHAQQHPQQAQMGYQGQQQPYQTAYQVSQPHAASPTPQYAPHPSLSGRREPPVVASREAWPQQQPTATQQQQQQQQQQHHQQQQQMHQHHQHPQHHHQPQHPQHAQQVQHQQPSAWPPTHQAAPKTSQTPVPAQSAWGAQHGGLGVQPKPPVSSPLAPQQHHSWSASGPSQPTPHPLNLRSEPRGPSVYDAQSPTGPGMVPHHQHHGSLGGGGGAGSRYVPAAPQDARRGGAVEPVLQPASQPAPPPPYARYASTPGPTQQARGDPGALPVSRTYTPVGTSSAAGGGGGAFDPLPRGPPPPPPQAGPQGYAPSPAAAAALQQQQQEAAMREHQAREAQLREMQQQQGRDPRDLRDLRDPRDLRDLRGEQLQQQGGGATLAAASGGGSGGGGGASAGVVGSAGGGGGILGRHLRPGPEGPPGPGGMYERREERRY
ncbi:uncharacterized protein THITE_2059762, partial [Thermothielavioides terrestris NRRL 8126]